MWQKAFPISLLLLLALLFKIHGQNPSNRYKFLHSDHGLSQSFVHCLTQDSSGFVWAGTQYGLNRFDGYQFHAFHKQIDTINSLPSNYIWSLHTDRLGNLWIGTTNGFSHYTPANQQFKNFQIPSEEPKHKIIRSLFSIDQQQLLVGTASGLFLVYTPSSKVQALTYSQDSIILDDIIYSINPINDTLLIIGGKEQLFSFHPQKKILQKIKTKANFTGGITAAYLNTKNHLWLGTGNGLWQCQINQPDSLVVIQHFQENDSSSSNLSSNFITSFQVMDNEVIWIGTNRGLNRLNTLHPEKGFTHYLPDPTSSTALKNYIFDIQQVESNTLWCATQDGIVQLNTKTPIFKALPITPQQGGTSIHGMLEDKSGNILMATEKGLIQLGPDQKKIQSIINTHNTPTLEDEFFINIRPAQDHAYWIALRRGGFGKVSTQDHQNYSWQNFKIPHPQYPNIGCNDLLETADQTLWIASSGLGLWKWNQKTNHFKSFQKTDSTTNHISGNYIFQLFQDSQERIWIATADGGLCQMNPKTEQFQCFSYYEKNPSSISSNMVLATFEDSQKRIWACTADGLNLYTGDGHFINFSTKDGLPNNLVYGMLEDENGYLWISTDYGISRLLFQNDQLECLNFTQASGLLKNEFNQHAFLKKNNGEILFGSIGGISFFHPEQVETYQITPKIVFTDFKLFNESVPIGRTNQKEDFHLQQHINHTSSITLPHHQDFLAFEFSGINFEDAKANQYAYQLEGLDQNWVYSGTRRFANYPGLRAGTYTFKVKAANHNQIWNKDFKSVQIILKSPPWKTPLAYCLYVIILSLIIYSIFRYRLHHLHQIELAKQKERIAFRKKSAKDFHDEAGNQITKISLLTEVAKRQLTQNPPVQSLLQQMEEDIQQLRNGMRDFIWVLDPAQDNLFNTLLRLKEFGHQFFEHSNIHFHADPIIEDYKQIELNGTHRRNILLIFKEAFNNALKYAEAKQVLLSFSIDKKILVIQFEDDGKGFNFSEKNQSSYGLSNMKNRSEKIGANLDIISQKNTGTQIICRLNITQMGN